MACSVAGIDQSLRLQASQRAPIEVEVVGLASRGLSPFQPQPSQIFFDRRLEFRPASGDVDILYTQQETAIRVMCGARGGQSGKGVTAMKITRGRRCEAGDEAGGQGA